MRRQPRTSRNPAAAVLAVATLLVVGCRREPSAARGLPAAGGGTSALAASAEPDGSRSLTRHVRRRASFPVSSIGLTIEDVHMSRAFDDVLRRTGAALVVNGGFFDPRGEPLGLAVSGGKALSAFAAGMSGGVLWLRDGVAHLTATEDYEAGAVDFAIQCRPRLVVASRPNVRSDDGRRALRTALCLRDGGRTLEAVLAGANGDAGPTLFELARELVDDGCEEALNLDGGPSTGWASVTDAGLIVEPPFGAVRHVVVLRQAPASPSGP
jgi:hypothetical protein